MTQSLNQDSAILYHNANDTIFLIDTPYSIALAQESLSVRSSPTRRQDQGLLQTQGVSALLWGGNSAKRRWLLSTPPLETPFPSTEPKSHAARAKVLERIPPSEQRFHGQFIQPFVESALHILRLEYQTHGGQWCLPRRVRDGDTQRQINNTRLADRQTSSARKRRNGDFAEDEHVAQVSTSEGSSLPVPPVILSSTTVNSFESISELKGSIVKNVSSGPAILAITSSPNRRDDTEYIIAPRAKFVLCTLPLSQPETRFPSKIIALDHPLRAIPQDQKFNLLLFDPPWPNRSVRRSGHYQINSYSEMDVLTQRLRDILRVHSYHTGNFPIESSATAATHHETSAQSRASLAAIWITNAEKARRAAYDALTSTGFHVAEEWIWIKTTIDGQPISAVDGLWRKPYEILVIGQADQMNKTADLDATAPATATGAVRGSSSHESDLLGIDPASIQRRVIAAVPDLHSRKPNLKEVFERVFFMGGDETEGSGVDESDAGPQSYSALEVFARNLTTGWWSCGNEVLKFNARECWVDERDS